MIVVDKGADESLPLMLYIFSCSLFAHTNQKLLHNWIKNIGKSLHFLHSLHIILGSRGECLFYKEKRYLALCGKEDFAHSFITSEYLYQTLRGNNEFDYTAIVSGYLKSVEQLLFRIEKFLLNNLPSEQLLPSSLQFSSCFLISNARAPILRSL